ncbi:unnamed protein product, partial [Bubo scandiacus]
PHINYSESGGRSLQFRVWDLLPLGDCHFFISALNEKCCGPSNQVVGHNKLSHKCEVGVDYTIVVAKQSSCLGIQLAFHLIR